MEIFLILTFLFAVGALCGWVLELFFRRFNSKKWINPGFCTALICRCTDSGWRSSFSSRAFRWRHFRRLAALCRSAGGHLRGHDGNRIRGGISLYQGHGNQALGLFQTSRKYSGNHLSAVFLLLDADRRRVRVSARSARLSHGGLVYE